MNKNIVITILVIIVLGLGGYLVYDKVIDKDEKVEPTQDTNTTINTDEEKQNDGYEVYAKNLASQMKAYQTEFIDSWKKEYVSFPGIESSSALSFDLKTNGDVYVLINSYLLKLDNEKQLNSKYGESYKLTSNVIDMYIVPEGNGGIAESVYFIKNDGSLTRMIVSTSTTEYKLEDNYKGLSKIVSVYAHPQPSGSNIIAIDINGNSHEL